LRQASRVSVLGNMAKYRIAAIDVPVPGTKIFRLEPLEGGVPRFRPGQWIFLNLLDGKGASTGKRPYSIASSPSAPYIELCIEMRGGAFTSLLDRVAAGTVVGVEGPQGRMTYEGERKAAFIAGGCGISAVMSMLRQIAQEKLDGDFILFHSVRTQDKMLYGDELERLKKENPRIRTVITLTRETPAGWAGECGRISREMIAKHAGKPAEFDWWICGPVEMVRSMRECLTGMGVDGKRMRFEAWG